jgi:hypothetical protein
VRKCAQACGRLQGRPGHHELMGFEHGLTKLLEMLDLRAGTPLRLRGVQRRFDVTPDVIELIRSQDVVLESSGSLKPVADHEQ